MKTKIIFFVLLILVSCAPIRKFDRVPEGVPKGYVEFYYLKSEGNIGFSFPVYITAHPTRDTPAEGWISSSRWIFGNKIGLRLSESPGRYTFYVGASEFSQPISVSIKEGMVIPVRMVFTNISKDVQTRYGVSSNIIHTTTISKYKFNIYLYPENPVPIVEYDKK
jgi:hypothetical protein